MTAKTYKIQSLLIFIFILFIGSQSLKAQIDRTRYFLDCIPQSNYQNPANIPDAKFYIAVPALSSLYLSFENNGFTYEDVISKRADDSLEITVGPFLDALLDNNSLTFDLNEEILAFGFRAKKNYFYFNISERFSTSFKYPKELFSLLLKGNAQYIGEDVSLEGISINANLFTEFALGYSREIDDRWTVGTRVKYLIGIANIWSEKTDLTLTTGSAAEAYAMQVNSDIIINTSAPYTIDNFFDTIGDVDWLKYTKNNGFAIDVGGKFKLNDQFTFSASLLDFGFIKWNEGVKNYVSKQANNTFSFEGLDINELVGGGEVSDSTFESVLDSIEETLGLDKTFNAYKAPLVTRFNIAALYSLTPRDRFGALIRGSISPTGLNPSLTLSYNRAFGRTFNMAVSYTAKNKNYLNFGIGTVLNIGAFQLYLVSDNIYSMIAPKKTRFVNFVFGMNVTVGRKKPPKIFGAVEEVPVETTPPEETPVDNEPKDD